jgi:fructose-bisphosphate aldolase class II
MLTNLKEILNHARRHQYAVPGFDCVADIMVRTILETAQDQRAPVILMCLTCDLEGNGMAYLPPLIRTAAQHHDIPVALHLDHAANLEQIRAAVENGFTSVMIDGSKLPFEENVALTRGAVEIARPYGASVEGELGHVGGMDLEATACAESVLTEPREVTRFVEETGVDALAVSIGTAHGVYQSLPNLAIDRLKELHAASSVPLVLHGGSGTPVDQIKQAVRHGISKLNIYADCRIAMAAGLRSAAGSLQREDPTPGEMFGPISEQLSQVVVEKIQLLNAQNQAWPAGATA